MDVTRARMSSWMTSVWLAGLATMLQFGAAQARAAHTPPSRQEIPQIPQIPEAREVFAEQMSGKPSPDDLGSMLPPEIPAVTIASLIVPADDRGPVGMVGLKPWAARPGWFVALACTGGNGPSKARVDGCSGGGSSTPLHAYVALLEKDGSGRLKLATRPVTIETNVDWSRSMLPNSPEAAETPAPEDRSALLPSAYDRLDLAPYRIAPGETAFGVRASWSDGYAGGFGWHSAMLLYAPVDGQLRQVLAVPTIALTFTAGEWHRDGTRDHEIEEGANVIIVTQHLNAGYADLVVRSRTTADERLFRWDAVGKRYAEAAERRRHP
uniref:hypothetical protein n=1 Tax=uncultured Sphingomonas sp. TaxID=158754 RepID=UPI0035C9C952